MDYSNKSKHQLINELELLQKDYDTLMEMNTRKSELILPEDKTLFHSLVDNLPHRIFIKDLNSVYILCNEIYASDLGITPDEIVGKDDFAFHPEKLALAYRCDDQEIIRTGKNKVYNEEYIIKGQEHWIHITKSPFYNNGEIIGVLGIFEDFTEHRRIEEQLYLSENKYRSIFENLQDIYYEISLDGILLEISPSIEIMTQGHYMRKNLIGKSIVEFYADNSAREMFLKTLTEKELIRDYELSFNIEDVIKVTCSVAAKIYKDKKGKPEKIVGTIHDITTRKNIERELKLSSNKLLEKNEELILATEKARESEIQQKELLNNALFPVIIASFNGKLIYLNRAAFDFFGVEYDRNLDEIDAIGFWVHPENRAYFVNQLITKGENINFESEFFTTDKRRKTALLSSSTINYRGGKVIFSIYNDITERKLAEEALRLSEDRFRGIFNNLQDAFFQADTKANFTLASPSVLPMYGYETVDELIGKPVQILYADLKEREILVEKLKVQSSVTDFICQAKRKDGTTFWVSMNVQLKYHNGKYSGTEGVVRDITDRKKIENDLILAKEKAEESDRLKTAFLTNMSHEIRTPMNGILGFANLLSEPGITGEEQQEFISMIQKSGKRMLNILHEIVDISRIESGVIQLNVIEGNINEQVRYVHRLVKPDADQKGITIRIETTLPDHEAIILTDTEKLLAVLANLVKNAIKYTDRGYVEFGYKIVETQGIASLQFFVKDTGIGIPFNRQNAIFERFVQADLADIEARQGAGLGLTIAKAYVEMMGGEIWVESKTGDGSVFYFTLPFRKGQTQEDIVRSIDQEKEIIRKHKSIKVLIVDDDEPSQVALTYYINKISKDILFAQSGHEAVRVCIENPDIDLILMDIRMPDMNGYESAREIRQFNQDVIIIAQTAFAMVGDKEKALDSGFNDYISKPINKNELFTLLKKNLR